MRPGIFIAKSWRSTRTRARSRRGRRISANRPSISPPTCFLGGGTTTNPHHCAKSDPNRRFAGGLALTISLVLAAVAIERLPSHDQHISGPDNFGELVFPSSRRVGDHLRRLTCCVRSRALWDRKLRYMARDIQD